MRPARTLLFIALLLLAGCATHRSETKPLVHVQRTMYVASQREQAQKNDRRALVGILASSHGPIIARGVIAGSGGFVVAVLPEKMPFTVGSFYKSVVIAGADARQSCDSLLQLITKDNALHIGLFSPIAPLASDCAIKDDFITPWNTFVSIELDGHSASIGNETMVVLPGSIDATTLIQGTLSGHMLTVDGSGSSDGALRIAMDGPQSFAIAGAFLPDGSLIGLPTGRTTASGATLIAELLSIDRVRSWMKVVMEQRRANLVKDVASGAQLRMDTETESEE